MVYRQHCACSHSSFLCGDAIYHRAVLPAVRRRACRRRCRTADIGVDTQRGRRGHRDPVTGGISARQRYRYRQSRLFPEFLHRQYVGRRPHGAEYGDLLLVDGCSAGDFQRQAAIKLQRRFSPDIGQHHHCLWRRCLDRPIWRFADGILAGRQDWHGCSYGGRFRGPWYRDLVPCGGHGRLGGNVASVAVGACGRHDHLPRDLLVAGDRSPRRVAYRTRSDGTGIAAQARI